MVRFKKCGVGEFPTGHLFPTKAGPGGYPAEDMIQFA